MGNRRKPTKKKQKKQPARKSNAKMPSLQKHNSNFGLFTKQDILDLIEIEKKKQKEKQKARMEKAKKNDKPKLMMQKIMKDKYLEDFDGKGEG